MKIPLGFELLLVLVFGGLGCSTVDPIEDYNRVMEAIEKATGQSGVLRPGSAEEAISKRVEALLKGGLSSTEVVELALLKNPSFQAAVLEVGLARADIVQSGLLSNPSLSGLIRFPLDGGKSNIEAGLSQNLIELWHRPVKKRFAEEALERAVFRVGHEGAKLGSESREAFFLALGAQEFVLLEEENLGIVQLLLETTLARQEEGAASEIDSNSARTEFFTQKVSLRRARLAAFKAKKRLAVVLNLDVEPESIELVESFPPLPEWELDINRLLAVASSHRLDRAAAEAAIRMAKQALSIEEQLFLRSIDGGLALEIEGSNNRALGPSASFELPIFDQNQARIAKAKMRLEQAQRKFDEISLAVTQEVRSAHEQLLASIENTRAYQEQIVPISERNLELARESYLAGKVTFLTVLESQRKLFTIRRQAQEQVIELALSIIGIESACGLPVNVLNLTY